MAITKIIKTEVKKVSVNFKQNVLSFLAETIANSGAIFANGSTEIDDITSLPNEVKIIKIPREPVLVFEVSGIQIKAAIAIPKTAVEGEILAIATANTTTKDDKDKTAIDENEKEAILSDIEARTKAEEKARAEVEADMAIIRSE